MTSDTKQIAFWRVLAFLLFGPITAVVYALYSFGYWLAKREEIRNRFPYPTDAPN
jgi:membrane protein required for beta-lactamase induction